MFPEISVSKVLLDSAHDADVLYEYFRKNHIVPFIDLNGKGGKPSTYKEDFKIGDDGVPIYPAGRKMFITIIPYFHRVWEYLACFFTFFCILFSCG